LKSSSEKEKASLERKLEITNSLLEQTEKDFQKQKAEVMCPSRFCDISLWLDI
jgi:hypothetical protein